MFNFLKKLFDRDSKSEKSIPDPDFTLLIANIRKRENAEEIAPGKKIHEFDYALYTLRLDRDIAKNYRITVFQGNERIYSFTVFDNQSNRDILEMAYRKVIQFLKSDQSIKNLPQSDILKGYYFGNNG